MGIGPFFGVSALHHVCIRPKTWTDPLLFPGRERLPILKGEQAMQSGLEVCLDDPPAVVQNGRWGLLMNQASVDWRLRYACDVLAERWPGRLTAIFSPQHGFYGVEQANMIESPHGYHRRLGVPIYSLYSDSRRPSAEALRSLDALLVDLQDVGTRVYTFVWTLTYCLEACAEAGIPLVVLDRPNPLGGLVAEGPLLDPRFASFVGRHAIPMRHALTIGEFARLIIAERRIDVELTVVPMRGWSRDMQFPATGRTWVAPSPNMPRFETALVYPGQVLWEGTNISEGRGTTAPFEVVGAPFIDADDLAKELAGYGPPGVHLRPIRFRPTFDKWRDEVCEGLSLYTTDCRAARPYYTSLSILAALRSLYPDQFAWLPPPYEYEQRHMPIDIITGGDAVRTAMDEGRNGLGSVQQLAALDESAWAQRVKQYWLYEIDLGRLGC